ncbi:hypothetical protein R1sor_015708 [Riccia sorocarpa]|uniref:Coenzyme Q-binding protein COQ10 START domain-containing protein n=1 Tax=Riccia sorocarpa TaxID=122646 RepID=A0ABD3HG07_9MARC
MAPIFNVCHLSASCASAELFFKLRKSCSGHSRISENVTLKDLLSIYGSRERRSVSCRTSGLLRSRTSGPFDTCNPLWLADFPPAAPWCSPGVSRTDWDCRPELEIVAKNVGKAESESGAESGNHSQRNGKKSKLLGSRGKDVTDASGTINSGTKVSNRREEDYADNFAYKAQGEGWGRSQNLDLGRKVLNRNDATIGRNFKEAEEESSEDIGHLSSIAGRITDSNIDLEKISSYHVDSIPWLERLKEEELAEAYYSEDLSIETIYSRDGDWIQPQDAREVDRNVEVEVEVVSWRERHIKAHICVEASDQMVWNVLTDYERLAEFIPNLVRSEVINSPQPGRVWLLQQGVQSSMYWHIEARVVLELEELPLKHDGKELRFSMVDGDFKRYAGRWYLRPGPRPGTTMLFYEVSVIPKLFFPAPFVERIIKADLPINLSALAQRAETDPSEWQRVELRPPRRKPKPTPSPLRSFLNKLSSPNFVQRFPLESIKSALQFPSFIERSGVDAIQRTLLNSREDEMSKWGSSSRTSTLDRPCAVDEVHLRRLDDLLEHGGVHRRVVAAITVQSPIKDVWNVLTDYECLSEFIPNLASSKIVSRESNRVRLVQEGCKCVLYMVLHARVVLDLWEKPEHEIIFQQVEGDFDSFQGKWTLEALGPQHTLLKYIVDTKMHKHCLLAEAIVEEVIYEDLPANLCAIRDRVEYLKQEFQNTEATPPQPEVEEHPEKTTEQRPRPVQKASKRLRVAGLQKDFRVLERELLGFIQIYGKEGVMPMRSELRQHRRVDLEKAITRMGGFSAVASKLKLCQQRRPRGYWDNFQNVRREIIQLQKECGMDPIYMPTRKALNNAGRPDVARALEKWGGANEVARLLGLKVRRVGQRSPRKTRDSATSDLENDEFTCPKPFKISLPEKPRKWVNMKQKVEFVENLSS